MAKCMEKFIQKNLKLSLASIPRTEGVNIAYWQLKTYERVLTMHVDDDISNFD